MENRIGLFIIGIIGSMCLIIYSINYQDYDLIITAFGINITKWFFAFIIVILSIIFGTITKSALLGKYRLD